MAEGEGNNNEDVAPPDLSLLGLGDGPFQQFLVKVMLGGGAANNLFFNSNDQSAGQFAQSVYQQKRMQQIHASGRQIDQDRLASMIAQVGQKWLGSSRSREAMEQTAGGYANLLWHMGVMQTPGMRSASNIGSGFASASDKFMDWDISQADISRGMTNLSDPKMRDWGLGNELGSVIARVGSLGGVGAKDMISGLTQTGEKLEEAKKVFERTLKTIKFARQLDKTEQEINALISEVVSGGDVTAGLVREQQLFRMTGFRGIGKYVAEAFGGVGASTAVGRSWSELAGLAAAQTHEMSWYGKPDMAAMVGYKANQLARAARSTGGIALGSFLGLAEGAGGQAGRLAAAIKAGTADVSEYGPGDYLRILRRSGAVRGMADEDVMDILQDEYISGQFLEANKGAGVALLAAQRAEVVSAVAGELGVSTREVSKLLKGGLAITGKMGRQQRQKAMRILNELGKHGVAIGMGDAGRVIAGIAGNDQTIGAFNQLNALEAVYTELHTKDLEKHGLYREGKGFRALMAYAFNEYGTSRGDGKSPQDILKGFLGAQTLEQLEAFKEAQEAFKGKTDIKGQKEILEEAVDKVLSFLKTAKIHITGGPAKERIAVVAPGAGV